MVWFFHMKFPSQRNLPKPETRSSPEVPVNGIRTSAHNSRKRIIRGLVSDATAAPTGLHDPDNRSYAIDGSNE